MAGLAELTIGYSSLAERVANIRVPEAAGDAEILVAVQGGGFVAHSSGSLVDHSDVQFIEVPGRGVAKSRNAVIANAGRRYLLFCDDDVVVDTHGIQQAMAHLRATGAALALGQGVDPEGHPRKNYPTAITRLTRFNSARAATYEMLIDVEQVRAASLSFDERFGAGAQHYLGDEYLFIVDLLRAGLRADAVPFVFGVHPAESSGSRWGGQDAHERAIVLNEVFGRSAVFVRTAFAVRRRGSLGGWGAALRFALDGTRA